MADPLKKIRALQKHASKYREHIAPVLDGSETTFPQTPAPRNISSTLTPYSGPWTERQIAHVLRRTLFGFNKADLKYFGTKTMEQTVNELLTTSPTPPPPINNYNSAEIQDPEIPYGETWINAKFLPDNPDVTASRQISFKLWWTQAMMDQKRNIHEKMILFWHNHLVVQTWDVFIATLTYNYQNTLRQNALGNFKELVKLITLDPAMLIYLNGAANNKTEPDENYGRELQELFCIGKGKDSKYTEDDVKAAARVLTGWSLNPVTLETTFYPFLHESRDKQFSSFYDNTLIKGRAFNAGKEELDDLLDMIFNTNELALFICRKIYTFFVYSEIDDFTEENVIQPMAEIFRSNNYEIKPVLDALFKSEHFFDEMNIGALIKSPIDMVMGFWRSMDIQYPTSLSIEDIKQYNQTMYVAPLLLGMELGDPPSVAGWPSYYQIPIFDKAWITSTTITFRGQLTDAFTFFGLWRDDQGDPLPMNLLGFTENMDDPGDPNQLIAEAGALLLGHPLTDEQKLELKSILLSGQQADYYWTVAWINYTTDPNEVNKQVVLSRLLLMYRTLFQLAEFQLM